MKTIVGPQMAPRRLFHFVELKSYKGFADHLG